MHNIASIDLGSHTARLLIARVGDGCGVFEPLGVNGPIFTWQGTLIRS